MNMEGHIVLLLTLIVAIAVEGQTGGYTCSTSRQGKRVHETTGATRFDCKDSRGANTCKGGQCVALVTCSCTRNGKHAPATRCWRPGVKVILPDGRCNPDIAANTAIATFPNGRSSYVGHAAIFIECLPNQSIKILDQWCSRKADYSTVPSSNRYYNQYYVITNPGVCDDRDSWPCRVETPGSSNCSA